MFHYKINNHMKLLQKNKILSSKTLKAQKYSKVSKICENIESR